MKLQLLLAFTLVLAVNAADKPPAAAAPAAPAKPKPKLPTYLTPDAGGEDYQLQGEYLSASGQNAAQIVAMGDDAFRFVFYPGGLPGAGWNGKVTKPETLKRADGRIRFEEPGGQVLELSHAGLKVTLPGIGSTMLKRIERKSPTLGAKAPAGAIVLFTEGGPADAFAGGHTDERGLLAAGCKTKQQFTNCTLHCEFLLPFKPLGRGQDRGNSGVYLQDRYELQVLDSFGLKGEDNECGGIYTKARPAVNMCFPPLTWQTYDIDFTAAKFDDAGKKVKNAILTVKHNGVVIHDNLEINGPTGGGKKEGPTGGAIQLQGHGNPVFYRNIWIVPKP
jgi:hypothetical protein